MPYLINTILEGDVERYKLISAVMDFSLVPSPFTCVVCSCGRRTGPVVHPLLAHVYIYESYGCHQSFTAGSI